MKTISRNAVLWLAIVGLASCATTHVAAVPTTCFKPAAVESFKVEALDRLTVQDSHHHQWRVRLRGACPELVGATSLVFSDEMALRAWPDQPWRHGYGFKPGWPVNGFYVNESSAFMRVCSNRQSWVHPFGYNGSPVHTGYASFGCRVDFVDPISH